MRIPRALLVQVARAIASFVSKLVDDRIGRLDRTNTSK